MHLEDKLKPLRRDPFESGHNTTYGGGLNMVSSIATAKHFSFAEKKPFHRTKTGIMILVIAAIVVLAAITGGVVGGVVKKNQAQSNPATMAPGSGDGDGGSQRPVGGLFVYVSSLP